MLRTVVYVTAAVIADGCAGLAGALVPERRLEQSRQALVGFATGVLVGTAFLDLLLQALAGASHAADAASFLISARLGVMLW